MSTPEDKEKEVVPSEPLDGADGNDDDDEGEVLEWTCHPLKARPVTGVVVTLFISLVGLAIYYSTDSRWFTILGMIVLFASLAKFYFPTTFRLSDKRIMVKTTTQTLSKDWSLFRSCYPDKNGILLSPFTRPSRLENFRGQYIMFNKNSAEVTAFVKARINRPSEEPDEESDRDDVPRDGGEEKA